MAMKKEFFIVAGLSLGLGGLVMPVLGLADHKDENHYLAGKKVYEGTCVACHGKNGKGVMPGIPDFTGKNSPLSKTDKQLFENIKNGFESPGSFMAMPPRGGNPDLTDQQIRYVVEFLRQEFDK